MKGHGRHWKWEEPTRSELIQMQSSSHYVAARAPHVHKKGAPFCCRYGARTRLCFLRVSFGFEKKSRRHWWMVVVVAGRQAAGTAGLQAVWSHAPAPPAACACVCAFCS